MSGLITEVSDSLTERHGKKFALKLAVLRQLCTNQRAVYRRGRKKEAVLRVVVFSLSSVVTSHCKGLNLLATPEN